MRFGIKAYTDLWHLCFWHHGQRAGQMSSHAETDRNIDLMHFHGRYKCGRVLANVKGPGVVYRIWSAGPSGTLYFYADGMEEPVVECDFKEYLTGECFTRKFPAVGRYTNYTPFYFKDSLIITARKFRLPEAYYQVSYMTYDRNPGIETTGRDGLGAFKDDTGAARKFWGSGGREWARDPGGEPDTWPELFELSPGGEYEIEVEGAGLVTELWVRDYDDFEETLEDVRMRISWDGDEEAAVDSPVDAFFGNRFNSRDIGEDQEYTTLAVSAFHGPGYLTTWPMPFEHGMKLVFNNHGDATQNIKIEMEYRKLDGLPDNAMRFHAQYREQDYPDHLSKDKIYGLLYKVDQSTNYVVLEREGKGYYAGCFLYVASLGSDWWGEGDEMIWVDGEEQALIRGTGTEDEFNWSFGFKENWSPISGALQVSKVKRREPQTTYGHNVLYRFRPGDYVPFTRSIKVTYERLGSTTEWMKRYPGALINVSHDRGDDYRSVAYWYELP
jgi:hypothetical protein